MEGRQICSLGRVGPGRQKFGSRTAGRDDLILQGANESESNFNYWIARRLFPGVYLIFPIVEADVDDATRNAICQSDSENTCTIKAHDQLVMLAQATAAKPLRNPALGVVVQK